MFDSASRRSGLVAGVRSWAGRPEYSKPHERFAVTTRDHVRIVGRHFRNDRDTLIVYCHGFLSGKDYATVPRFVELLADETDAIAFDFRGHGESGGSSTLGERELLDLDSVLDHAGRFPYSRVVLLGSSMGASVAIRYAASSERVAGVATIGAFAYGSFGPLAARAMDLFLLPFARSLVRATRGARVDTIMPRSNPIEVVRRLTPRPLLLIHGQFDPLIPLSHAHALYERAGQPKRLIVIPRGSHDLPNLNKRTKDLIVSWMKEDCWPSHV